MSSVLKGNFQPQKTVNTKSAEVNPVDLETRFEMEALKRLGGSIAFVKKKKVAWDIQED